MVQIANPIYDVVFKYLMNDEKVAKLLLSAIIGKEVVSLEFRPTEHHFPVGEMLMVLRMDFSARILDENGNQELIKKPNSPPISCAFAGIWANNMAARKTWSENRALNIRTGKPCLFSAFIFWGIPSITLKRPWYA
jgi:hypothetical protein